MKKTADMLIEAMAQALEKMAFMTVLPVDDYMVIPETTMLARIDFTGPKCGSIAILAGPDFADLIAKNMGAMDQVDDQTCCDALRELANVTCGLVVPMISSSPTEVFDVSVPAIDTGADSPKWQQFTAAGNGVVLNVEGHAVAMTMVCRERLG